mmetsp:Transcript_37904/g.108260  ORF Transcript_37904/g.108260 Transcript_37904/m.108260 type:complete len:88 (+) Transcript_37904:1766-2029(+)
MVPSLSCSSSNRIAGAADDADDDSPDVCLVVSLLLCAVDVRAQRVCWRRAGRTAADAYTYPHLPTHMLCTLRKRRVVRIACLLLMDG